MEEEDDPPPRRRTSREFGGVGKFDAQRGAVFGEAALLMGGHADSPDEAPQSDLLQQRRKSLTAMMRRKVKPTVAPEELTSVREYLMATILSAKQDLLAKISHATSVLEGQLQELKDKLARDAVEALETRSRDNALHQQFTTDCAKQLAQDLSATRYMLEDKLHRSFELTKLHMREMQHYNNSAHQRLEQIVHQVQAQQSAATAVRWSSTVALLDQQRRSTEESLENLRSEMAAGDEATYKKATDDLAEFVDRQRERDAAQDACLIENHNDLQRRMTESDENMSGHARTSDGQMQDFKRDMQRQIVAIREDADHRLKVMEKESERLFTVVSVVENIPTRRVEWIIKDAAAKLNFETGKSWFSPKFEAAGAHNLQLELRMLSPSGRRSVDTPSPGDDDGNQGSFGDCAVYLWAADANLRLVCKLYVGRVCKEIQHTFDGGVPCGTGRFGCMVREQIENGSLKVGIEILEAVREVQNTQRTETPGGEAAQRRGEVVHGPIMSHRYLNHRTLELVQTQVDLMRSRMVRRIEWRLQQASLLPRCFPEGESLCSTTFEAAGVGDMQLVFYPSGYTGAKEGYCSFFLHCPAGSSLRCWLVAGKQRREAKLAFEQAGFFGRTNFCRYENCVDPSDDSILLVLEIDEAQQSLTETMWHQPAAKEPVPQQLQQPEATGQVVTDPRSTVGVRPKSMPQPPVSSRASSTPAAGRPRTSDPSRQATPPNDVDTDQVEPLPEKIDSSVKLTRAPGKVALEDVKQLPSIWTSRPKGNITEALEGYHNFENIHRIKKPMSARGPRPFEGRIAAAANGVLAPQVAPRYLMYAT